MSNKKVYFVRHGEAEGNTSNFFQFPETKLTKSGHRGAIAVAKRLQHLEVNELIASPFVRTQVTAQYISDALKIPFVTLKAFHEVKHAEVVRGKKFDSEEGRTYTDAYLRNFCDINWRPQGAENYHDVLVRAQEGIDFLEQSSNQNIVVVSHGNFIRFIAAYLLLNKEVSSPELFVAVREGFKSMGNVGISEFECDNGRWKLFTWNDHAHFAE